MSSLAWIICQSIDEELEELETSDPYPNPYHITNCLGD